MARTLLARLVTIVTALVALLLVNLSIAQQERLLARGKVVLLELAPVDPRSLMQGDYMALRFALGEAIERAIEATTSERGSRSVDGVAVVRLDERRVATFSRFDDGRPLAADEARVRYRLRRGDVKFATDAFFFQEGDAARYAGAKYGEFRAGEDGAMLLAALRGPDLAVLGSALRR